MTNSTVSAVQVSAVQVSAVSGQASKAALLPAVLISAFVGAFIFFGVGFAHSNVLHNAAHDSRHAIGFPCH